MNRVVRLLRVLRLPQAWWRPTRYEMRVCGGSETQQKEGGKKGDTRAGKNKA